MSTANVFSRTIPFLVERHNWGGHKKASLAHVTIGDAPEDPTARAEWEIMQARVKAAVSLNKRLLNSPALQAINRHDAAFRLFLSSQAATPFRRGLYLVPVGMIAPVNTHATAWATERERLADAAAEEYPDLIEEAPQRLGPLFNRADYPSVERFRAAFWVHWRFVDMGVPNLLREVNLEAFEQARRKMAEEAEQASAMIQQHLRSSLLEITEHIAGLLAPRANGHRVGIRQGALDGLKTFLATLEQRDTTEDESLRAVARRLLQVSTGVDVDQLKDDDALRSRMAFHMDEAKADLERLIEEIPVRRGIILRDAQEVA